MIPAIGSGFPSLQSTTLSGLSQPQSATAPAATGGGSDFASVLAKVANDATDTVKNAEQTSINGINGQATTQSVVESVMAAERTLQTAVALRDKAISAYLEVSRMAI